MNEELIKLQNRKKKLLESIRFTEQNKEEIIQIPQTLLSRYNSGRISKIQYYEQLNKALNGKSVEKWVKYYADYLGYYNYQLQLCEKLIKEEKKKKPFVKPLPTEPVKVYRGWEERPRKKRLVPVLKISVVLVLVGILISLFVTLQPIGTDVFKITGEKVSTSIKQLISVGEDEIVGEDIGGLVSEKPEIVVMLKDEQAQISEEELIQYQAVVGQPVKWKKRFTTDSITGFSVELPEDSKNVKVIKFKDGEKQDITNSASVGEKLIGKEIKVDISNRGITGLAVGGDVGSELEGQNYEIVYETAAPTVEEEIMNNGEGKRVIVKGPDYVHYENVLSFVNIGELTEQELGKYKLYQVKNNKRELVRFTAYDTNENGLYDTIEWITPQLSEEVFEWIIEITKAKHLDENREEIRDIFGEVKALDNIWSETINNNEYVRVTFESLLDNSRDITVYPRIITGNPRIEVYEVGENDLIAEFENIVSNEYNKVFLTNLDGEQDVFDLKILDGSVEFDYIVDPSGIILNYPANNAIDVSIPVDLSVTVTDPESELMDVSFWREIKSISTGANHACGILANNKVMCWGNDDNGQIGDVTAGGKRFSPVFIDTPETFIFVSIAAGYHHSCGVLENGTALCWGKGSNGRLGYGGSGNKESPFPVNTNEKFVSISVGQEHSCGIITNGSAMCWGQGADGKLGNDDTSNQLSPVLVKTSGKFVSIAAGGGHSCGILEDGTALCWGSDGYGKLGDGGGRGDSSVPVPVSTNGKFVSLSTGNQHACGILEDGTALCWGSNENNQLGTGGIADKCNDPNDCSMAPILVDTNEKFVSIEGGRTHTCGVLSNEKVMCWGSNTDGKIGDGNQGPGSPTPSPVFVNSAGKFVSIDAGGWHTCGMLLDKTILCWGRASYGQLGYGPIGSESCSSGEKCSRNPIAVSTDEAFKSPIIVKNFNVVSGSETIAEWNEPEYDRTYLWSVTADDGSGILNSLIWKFTTMGDVDITPPWINFTYPTPANASSQYNKNIFVNLSSQDNQEHYSFVDFDKSLVLWMRMDDVNEAGTLIYDNSSYGNNGTAVDAYQIEDGYFGKAFEFDGGADYIEVVDSDPISVGNQDYTISAWVYPRDITSHLENPIVAKLEGHFNKEYAFGIRRYGRLSLDVENDENNGRAVTSTEIVTTNNWQHVSVVFDSASTTPTFYHNGQAYGPTENNIDTLPDVFNNNLYIGVWGGENYDKEDYDFNGIIDEVMIFNRTLSATEISALYSASTNQYYNNFTGLSPGIYNFTGYAVDKAGNVNQTDERFVGVGFDVFPPEIDFTSLTPLDETTTTDTSIEIEVNISDGSLDEVVWNWDGTNYTMMNDSLVLMMNFDNVSAIGENDANVVDVSGYGNDGSFLSKDSILFVSYAGISGGGTGSGGHPVNHDELIEDYVLPITLKDYDGENKILKDEININSGLVDYINLFFTTWMDVQVSGDWQFAIDGDDSVEVEIDGTIVSTYYGGHGFCGLVNIPCSGSTQGSINLDEGLHKVIVRHEDDFGGEGVVLYFKAPGEDTWQTFDVANLNGKATLYASIPEDSELTTLNFIENGLSLTSRWVSGKYGMGVEFDGVDDYIEIDSPNLPTSMEAITVAAWVNIDSLVSSQFSSIVNTEDWYTINKGFSLRVSTDYAFAYGDGSIINSMGTSPTGPPNYGKWDYVVGRFDGTRIDMYVNGKYSNGGFVLLPNPILIDNTKEIWIGKENVNGGRMDGSIDEVRIWNRALSSDEIKQQYFSNLRKYDVDKWMLYVNQSKDATSGLDVGTYTYQAFAKDEAGNFNMTEERSVTIGGGAPTIINWTINSGSPTSCTNTSINSTNNNFRITVRDLNGWGDMEEGGSVEVYFEKEGVTRPGSTNPSICTYSDNDGVNIAYYNCSINMTYYDGWGDWVVYVDASDGGLDATPQSSDGSVEYPYFNYILLADIRLIDSDGGEDAVIEWDDDPAINIGTINRESDTHLIVENCGNVNINLKAVAQDLVGENNNDVMGADSFSVGTSNPCNVGTTVGTTGVLFNNNAEPVVDRVVVLNSLISKSADGTPSTDDLLFCLESVEIDSPQLRPDNYKTEEQYPWEIFAVEFFLSIIKFFRFNFEITILLSIVAVKVKKSKKKKKDKKKLKLREEDILGLDSVLKDKYNIGLEELLESRQEVVEEKLEIKIPIVIFKQGISPAEALAKYLKENMKMRFSEIAKRINRDERTIWINYRDANKKKKEKMRIERKVVVSVEIFADRRLSILESVVYYFKEKGYRNVEIAEMLGKDQRNISTLYLRIKRKLNIL